MKTLQEEIAELTAKHNIQAQGQNMFPDLKVFCHAFSYKEKDTKYCINIDLLKESYNEVKYTKDEILTHIQTIIATLPPTKNNVLTFASGKDIHTVNPYVLHFNNGVNTHNAEIQYISGEYWVHIKLPISFYEGDEILERYSRNVSDSEYHYFGGTSMSELRRMQLRAYRLRMFDHTKYYGGDVNCYLMKEEAKEQFESIVLTGKKIQVS